MRERLRAVRLLLAFPFKVDTYRTAGALLLIFCGQLAGVGVAIGLALTTDGAVTRSGDRAIAGIAIFCVSALLSSLGNWGSFVLQTNLLDRATLAVDLELVQLTCSIEGIEHLERPEYLDRIEHLNQNRQNLVTVPTRAATILASGLRLALTVVLLARVEPLLALLVLAGIPLLLASTRRNRKLIQVWDEVGSPTMRLQYVLRHIAGQESGAREIRVFGIQEEFKRGYTRLWNTFTAAFDRVSLGGALLEALAAAFLALAVGLGLVLVAHQADSGAVTAGNLVLVLTLISQINLHLGILAGTANSVGGRYKPQNGCCGCASTRRTTALLTAIRHPSSPHLSAAASSWPTSHIATPAPMPTPFTTWISSFRSAAQLPSSARTALESRRSSNCYFACTSPARAEFSSTGSNSAK